MTKEIVKELSKFIKFTNLNKSSHWKKYLTDQSNYQNPFEPLGFGAFKKKFFFFSFFHKILSLMIFGNKIFSSKSYKNYSKVFNLANRQIDVDVMRHICTFNYFFKKKLFPSKLCIIGDGKANFVIGALVNYPQSQIISVNLTETLINDYLVLKKMNLISDKDIQIIQSSGDEIIEEKKLILVPSHLKNFLKNKSIDLFANIASFQEMNMSEISDYLKIIKTNNCVFYCCNREYKKLIGGEELVFDKYPFGIGKKIVYENCEWHQKYYSLSFPFFRKYDGNHKHCLIDYKI